MPCTEGAMEDDWGEGDGGGVEAPEPPLRPEEAGALRAAGRFDAAAIRCPAEVGRAAGDWRLAASAGNGLAAAATGVAEVSATVVVGTGVNSGAGAATSAAFTVAVTTGAGGEVAAAAGAVTSVPLVGIAATAGLAAAAPGTTWAAAPDLAEDRVRAVRLAIVHVEERNWSGGDGPCTGVSGRPGGSPVRFPAVDDSTDRQISLDLRITTGKTSR